MELRTYDSAVALLEDVGGYLAEREAEHNLQLAILGTLRDQPDVYKEPPYLAAVWDHEHVALVASRTPPFDLVLSEPGVPDTVVPAALEMLAADLAVRDPGLPGVLGPPKLVVGLVARWTERTGTRAEQAFTERIFRLTEVRQPPMPPGHWRYATEADRGLLIRWAIDFHAEALDEQRPPRDVEETVGFWIRRHGRVAYLWEIDGRCVSLVVTGPPTPTGTRVGPVYTPPADRGRGFASALTAAASQDQLDAGRRCCFLFTDISNPTSNKIYQAIGYEPVADVAHYRFIR